MLGWFEAPKWFGETVSSFLFFSQMMIMLMFCLAIDISGGNHGCKMGIISEHS
jgi:hypothetical protein